MAIDLQNRENIQTGWPGPQKFDAPSIGSLVSGILENRYRNQKLQQDTIANAIKEFQQQRESSAYIEAAQKAGLLPEGDYGGLGLKGGSDIARLIAHQNEASAREAYMKPYYEALTERAGRPSGGGRGGGGVPRYDYHGVLLTGAEYQKRLDQDRATQNYGALSAQEAEAQARGAQYEKKYGVDTDAGGLKAPGFFADQPTKDQFARDQAEYFKSVQDATRIRKQRENYEKWYRGMIQQPGGAQPGAQTDDEEDGITTSPQTSGTSLPDINKGTAQLGPDAQARIQAAGGAPAATPRPNAPPPADSAAGHAPTYGTPAPGVGAGQVGDLVPGQSKRFVGGKPFTWWGDKGWLPD